MRPWNFVALFLSLTLLASSPATAQAQDAKPDLGANAAMKYWQAFALLPILDQEPIMIVQLVGYAIETIAIEVAAPYLPELKPVISQAVSDVLDGLPAGPTLSQMVLQEKQTGPMWLIKELKKAEKRKEGSWHDVWKQVLSAPGEGDAVDRDLVESAKTFEQAIKLLEDLLPFYEDLAKVSALPWKEFDEQYPKFVKKAKAANRLAGYILPATDKMVAAQRRNQTQMALF